MYVCIYIYIHTQHDADDNDDDNGGAEIMMVIVMMMMMMMVVVVVMLMLTMMMRMTLTMAMMIKIVIYTSTHFKPAAGLVLSRQAAQSGSSLKESAMEMRPVRSIEKSLVNTIGIFRNSSFWISTEAFPEG